MFTMVQLPCSTTSKHLIDMNPSLYPGTTLWVLNEQNNNRILRYKSPVFICCLSPKLFIEKSTCSSLDAIMVASLQLCFPSFIFLIFIYLISVLFSQKIQNVHLNSVFISNLWLLFINDPIIFYITKYLTLYQFRHLHPFS